VTYSIRPYEDGDQPRVLDLLQVALGETEVLQRSPDLFTWKHLDNPFGRSIMLVAEDDEGLVGFRAFMRWELVTPSGRTLRCARPVDTATHPRARRQGVFTKLTEEAVKAASADGVDLIFNTPNPQSGAGYLKMGWTEVGTIGVMLRPLVGFWGRTGGFPAVEGAAGWRDPKIEDRPPRGLRTSRRADYLCGRYGSHPAARYSVVESGNGLAVFRSNVRNGRAELVVSDLLGTDTTSAVRRAARSTDAAYLVGWASKRTPERRSLLAAGLVPVPRVTALTLVAHPLRGLEERTDELAGWDLMLGDLELL
jgi:GNAT superfamily N-acetyltransferase